MERIEKPDLRKSLETVLYENARSPTEHDYQAGLTEPSGEHDRFFIRIPAATQQEVIVGIIREIYQFQDYEFKKMNDKPYRQFLQFRTPENEHLTVRLTRHQYSEEQHELFVSTQYV